MWTAYPGDYKCKKTGFLNLCCHQKCSERFWRYRNRSNLLQGRHL